MNAKHKIEFSLMDGIIYDGKPAVIVGTKDEIKINCIVVTVKALRTILNLHSERFDEKEKEYVLQSGILTETSIKI